MVLTTPEAAFLGTVLEGLLYGVYIIIFAIYLRTQNHSGSGNNGFLAYPLFALFILCTLFFAMDFADQYIGLFLFEEQPAIAINLSIATSAVYVFVDFISQGILIYRCWVMWGHLLLAIVPTIMAFASMALGLSLVAVLNIFKNRPDFPDWGTTVGVASFAISLAVNTIVTGMLVLKLALVHREYKMALLETKMQGHNLKPLISMLIESGMITFVGQLIWVVLFKLQNPGFNTVTGPITMLYAITPTIVVVRVKMGASYENRAVGSVQSTTVRFKKATSGVGTGTDGSVAQSSMTGRTLGNSTDNLELKALPA